MRYYFDKWSISMSGLQGTIGMDSVQGQSALDEVKRGALAWASESLPDDAGIIPLDEACLKELMDVARILNTNALPIVALRPEDFEMSICRDLMRQARETLDTGVGFIIIDRLPIEQLDPESATRLYWLLGNMISRAVAQKWDGTMKYDVRDSGKAMSPGNGVRASITNKAQQFHTDNSFNLPPEYVSLLCLQAAKEGGLSGVVSFQTVHNRLLQRHRDLLHRLYQPFWFDRQMEHSSNDPNKVNKWPMFTRNGEQLCTRFSKRLIYGGYEVAGEALDEVGRAAIDAVESILHEPGMVHDFSFEPGQIQILNNRCLGHRRTGFEDWPEPERRRHLVRLWFRDSGRPFYNG